MQPGYVIASDRIYYRTPRGNLVLATPKRCTPAELAAHLKRLQQKPA